MPNIVQEITKLFGDRISLDIRLLIQAVIAIILLFAGFKFIRFWLGLTGVSLGIYLGGLLVERFQIQGGFAIVIYLLMALAGAAFLSTAFKVCFLIAGFVAGLYLGQFVLSIFFVQVPELYLLLFAAVIAILAASLRYQFTLAATAISGSMLLVDSLVAYFYNVQAGSFIEGLSSLNLQMQDDLIILALLAALSALGIWVQSKNKKHKNRYFA